MKSTSSTFRVGLIIKAALGVAVMATISLVVMSRCSIFENKWYYATYKHGVQFVGTKGKNGQVEYFSVRVGSHDAQAVPVECELEFHWKGQNYLIRELGLNDLAKMGIGAESVTGDARGVTAAFLGGKNGSHRDFGVEFYFRDGRICHFYARHSSHNATASPFLFSIAHRQAVPFPLRDEQLQKSFGIPESVVAIRGK